MKSKEEKATIKILSFVIIIVASIIYMGFIQIITDSTNKQMTIILIMIAIWIMGFENLWRYVKEKNK